jgi:antitoxin (DNA-binding transcriptional repressor) of toxin-antitoxin stability system
MTITVSKSKLKARMLEIFRQLETSGDELIVTDQGRPVLRITPIREKKTADALFGDIRGRVIIRGDLNEPTTDDWEDLG